MSNINLFFMYPILCVYCILDAYHTKLLLDMGAYEINPLMNWLMDVTGTWVSLLIFKVFFPLYLGIWLIIDYRKKVEKL